MTFVDRDPDLSRIPRQFICPISMEIMVDPVITTAGLTYERAYIEEWFRRHTTDPMAHVPVVKILTPNIALKQQIEEFMAHFAGLHQYQQDEEDAKLAMQLRIDELNQRMETKALELSQMQQHIEDHIATLSISQVRPCQLHNHRSSFISFFQLFYSLN